MTPRRVLVANYDYPPGSSVGGIRWLTMKKYLERLGYEVSVLTTNAFGRLPDDESQHVVRAADLVASRRLRRALARPALADPGQDHPTDTAPPAVLTSVLVPDMYAVSWVPDAVRQMRRIVREQKIDALVTTSPKDSTHLLGLARGRLPLAWVADFRDGWVFESTRPPLPTRAQRALDAKLEAIVVRRADAVVAFSQTLAKDFERRLGRTAFYVSNGWDPDVARSVEEPTATAVPHPRRAAVRLVYTGTLTGAERAPTDRSPVALLEALRILARREPDLASRIELVVAGRRTERDVEILSQFDHLGIVEHLGYVPRSTSLALQRSADVLVVVSGTTPSSIPLKIFEYLGARRPILHLGHPGEAARVLEDTGTGVTAALDDPEGIVGELRRAALGEFAQSYSPRNLERYAYPYVAERMAEVIQSAIAAHRSRRA